MRTRYQDYFEVLVLMKTGYHDNFEVSILMPDCANNFFLWVFLLL